MYNPVYLNIPLGWVGSIHTSSLRLDFVSIIYYPLDTFSLSLLSLRHDHNKHCCQLQVGACIHLMPLSLFQLVVFVYLQ